MIAHVHDSFSASKCRWFFRVLGAWALILSPAFGQAPQISQETKAPPASKNSASKSVESVSDQSTAKGKYFVEGSVVEEETGKPIAKASLRFVLLGEMNPDKRTAGVLTDEKGKFRLEVPIGNAFVWITDLKPGFWLPPEKAYVSLSTTNEKPVATLDVKAKRGPVWSSRILVENGLPENKQLTLTVLEIEDQDTRTKAIREKDVSGFSRTPNSSVDFDRQGMGQFTQLGKSGKMVIAVGAFTFKQEVSYESISSVITELIVDPKFDVTRVKSVNLIPGSDATQLIDESGAKAIVGKAQVTLQNGHPLLTFHLTKTKLSKQGWFGKVVDPLGNPIPSVEIRTILGSPSVSFGQPGVTKTDSRGQFQMEVPHNAPERGEYLKLSFTKNGFAGIDSREFSLPRESGKAIDVGMISLVPGKTVPILVVDEKDQPVPGTNVWLHGAKENSYAQNNLIFISDQKGQCVARNLPVGLLRVHLSRGNLWEYQSIVVSPIDSENTELKFRLRSTHPMEPIKPEQMPPLGQFLPEMIVDRWTDGQHHTLADFRGQVVVLNYWSMAWDPSVLLIPSLKEVIAKYQPKGVVFLSIHSPEGDMNQIKRFQKMMDWKILTGVDQGKFMVDGATLNRFGGQNPSTIIIDAEGKLAYHSRIPPKVTSPSDQEKTEKENKDLAASLNIPWPLPSQDDAQSRAQRDKFHAAILGKEIEKVMVAMKK